MNRHLNAVDVFHVVTEPRGVVHLALEIYPSDLSFYPNVEDSQVRDTHHIEVT